MSFEEKLNIVIKEIGEVYHLTPGALNNIKKNIIVRNNMYKDIQPIINKDETTFIKDTNSVGDVLKNRLVNNIRSYDLLTEFNPNIVTKGTYTGKKQTLYLESYSSIKTAILDKMKNRIQKVDEDTLKKAVSKVFDHEVGHALQKSFTGIRGFNDQNFKELVNRLTTKYPTVFEAKYKNEELQTIQAGMIPNRKDDKKSKIRRFYSRVAYTTHLDEIFNDSEALETTDTKKPQLKYDFGNGLNRTSTITTQVIIE